LGFTFDRTDQTNRSDRSDLRPPRSISFPAKNIFDIAARPFMLAAEIAT